MPKNRFRDANICYLEKTQLLKLKLKAIRSGVWFRALPRIDRVLVDLTIKVAGTVRSFTLANNILSVVKKLESIMEGKFLRAIREVGIPRARKIALVAQKWGNDASKNWDFDGGLARYLAVMSINEPRLFGG